MNDTEYGQDSLGSSRSPGCLLSKERLLLSSNVLQCNKLINSLVR